VLRARTTTPWRCWTHATLPMNGCRQQSLLNYDWRRRVARATARVLPTASSVRIRTSGCISTRSSDTPVRLTKRTTDSRSGRGRWSRHADPRADHPAASGGGLLGGVPGPSPAFGLRSDRFLSRIGVACRRHPDFSITVAPQAVLLALLVRCGGALSADAQSSRALKDKVKARRRRTTRRGQGEQPPRGAG